MKTERDKLIELAKKVKSDIFNEFAVEELVDNFIKESINPRNEPDGHRRLEDNKLQEKKCGYDVVKCDFRGSNKLCKNNGFCIGQLAF